MHPMHASIHQVVDCKRCDTVEDRKSSGIRRGGSPHLLAFPPARYISLLQIHRPTPGSCVPTSVPGALSPEIYTHNYIQQPINIHTQTNHSCSNWMAHSYIFYITSTSSASQSNCHARLTLNSLCPRLSIHRMESLHFTLRAALHPPASVLSVRIHMNKLLNIWLTRPPLLNLSSQLLYREERNTLKPLTLPMSHLPWENEWSTFITENPELKMQQIFH